MDLMDSDGFEAFKKQAVIQTLNQNMQDREVSFTKIKDIILGLYKTKLLWKMDLEKGYRHQTRHENS